MSSTSAVAVLAQGLRELRDFAEGPDGEELRERTGLTDEQIQAALGGEHLPTREVTLALVAAWEGDVEAWREYWGQIAELANEDEGSDDTPAPPEPSIITPIPAEGSVEEPTEEPVEAEQAAKVEPAAEAEQAAKVGQAAEAEQAAAEADELESAQPDEQPADAGVEQEAGSSDAQPPTASPQPKPAVTAPARPKRSPMASIGIPILLFAIGVTVGAFGDHALNSKQSSTTTAASLPPAASSSSPSHARTSSAPSSATSSAATSSSAAGTPSSAGAGSSPTDSSTSASPSSTVTPGTVLGAYVGIQLASGYSVNFMSDPYHPAAGTADGPDTMGFFASSFVDGRFYADRVAILDPTDTGSFTSCLNDTRYQHDVLLTQITNGSSFCITTSTGHLVLVTVRRMPSSTDANPYAVLDVTVWQGS